MRGRRPGGATATVTSGGFGIWVPGDYWPAPELVALDADGVEIGRLTLEVQPDGKGSGLVPSGPPAPRSPSP